MLFMGIAVKPEWDTSVLLEPSAVNVDIILTRQFHQTPRFMRVVEKIRRIVQEELAVGHITAFHGKLDQITPRGYRFDPETHTLIENPIRLAAQQHPIPGDPEGTGSYLCPRCCLAYPGSIDPLHLLSSSVAHALGQEPTSPGDHVDALAITASSSGALLIYSNV